MLSENVVTKIELLAFRAEQNPKYKDRVLAFYEKHRNEIEAQDFTKVLVILREMHLEA